MRKIIAVALLLLIFNTAPATAQNNGNELLSYCERFLREYRPLPNNQFQTTSDPVVWQCYGYVKAVFDFAYPHFDGAGLLPHQCLPGGTTVVQLIRVIVNYGRQQPEELHLPASGFAMNALIKAFPCNE